MEAVQRSAGREGGGENAKRSRPDGTEGEGEFHRLISETGRAELMKNDVVAGRKGRGETDI